MTKSIAIIGATCNLGIELSKLYANDGYDIILISRDKTKNQNLKKLLQSNYRLNKFTTLELDILNLEDQIKIFNEINVTPDGLISLVGETHNFKNIVDKNFFNVISVNFTNLAHFINLFLEKFEKRRYGFLICVSSVSGLRGRAKNFIYGSAKAALNTYLSGCRNFFNDKNIFVMTVLPGFINNHDTKNKSILSINPDKLAKKIFFAHQKKKEVIYSNLFWFMIMSIIRLMPNRIFNRLNF